MYDLCDFNLSTRSGLGGCTRTLVINGTGHDIFWHQVALEGYRTKLLLVVDLILPCCTHAYMLTNGKFDTQNVLVAVYSYV